MEDLKLDNINLNFSHEYYSLVQEYKNIQMDKREKGMNAIIVPYVNTPNSDIKRIDSIFSKRIFKLSMNRNRVNPKSVTYQIRDSSTGAPIIRVDINKSHNKQIRGSHIHFFDPLGEKITLPLSNFGIEKGEEKPVDILKDMLDYFHVRGFRCIIEEPKLF